MKIFRIVLIVVSTCFIFFPRLQAQTAAFIINRENKEIVLLPRSGGPGLIIPAGDSVWSFDVDVSDIYYVYRQIKKSPQVVEKVGFCRLTPLDGAYEFAGDKLPIFVKNNSEQNVLLEFSDMVVSLPAGGSFCADDLVIEPDLTALVYLSGNDSVSAPGFRLLSFTINNGSLSANLW
ncbi:MAG TPA: hypothetical protein PLI25_00635 [bacterium]|jgi:hypothetical protein|nr:hypothetical protein [bacterium]